MSADEDLEARTCATPGLLRQLKHHRIEGHGVIAADHASLLVTQNLIEREVAERDPSGRGIARRAPATVTVLLARI